MQHVIKKKKKRGLWPKLAIRHGQATCGRELEAGLRRRPGSNNVTFDGKPLDGVFVMHRVLIRTV